MDKKQPNSSKVGGTRIDAGSKNNDSVRGRLDRKDSSRAVRPAHHSVADSRTVYFSKEPGFECLGTGPGGKIKDHKK